MRACARVALVLMALQMLGHDARLMPANYVRPYSKGQKNDFRDTEAIAGASRPVVAAAGRGLTTLLSNFQ
jgi:transposase